MGIFLLHGYSCNITIPLKAIQERFVTHKISCAKSTEASSGEIAIELRLRNLDIWRGLGWAPE